MHSKLKQICGFVTKIIIAPEATKTDKSKWIALFLFVSVAQWREKKHYYKPWGANYPHSHVIKIRFQLAQRTLYMHTTPFQF